MSDSTDQEMIPSVCSDVLLVTILVPNTNNGGCESGEGRYVASSWKYVYEPAVVLTSDVFDQVSCDGGHLSSCTNSQTIFPVPTPPSHISPCPVPRLLFGRSRRCWFPHLLRERPWWYRQKVKDLVNSNTVSIIGGKLVVLHRVICILHGLLV